jgi:rSAM/selenodomain-associated transferase 1
MTGDALAIFLKDPSPGTVKTRLIPSLGAEGAAQLYRVLAEDIVLRTGPLQGELERVGFFAPAGSRAAIESWLPGLALIAQEGDDLGARMSLAFDEVFRRGAGRAALIGTDVPGLSLDHVRTALASLESHDLVLGPAHDGGYYLIGLTRPCPGLFRGIAWSTASVFAATMERAAALGLSVRVLEPLRDIDTLDDVRAEWPRIASLVGPGRLGETLSRLLAPSR